MPKVFFVLVSSLFGSHNFYSLWDLHFHKDGQTDECTDGNGYIDQWKIWGKKKNRPYNLKMRVFYFKQITPVSEKKLWQKEWNIIQEPSH